MSISTTLLLSTYNKPDYLCVCLQSAMQQSVMPNEIIVADDGSDSQTAEVIERYRKQSSVPIVHVWHEDNGFRKTIILNKAIAAAKSDYIIQIDGDIVLHPNFVEDHISVAQRGTFSCGSRVVLDKHTTQQMLYSCSTTIPAHIRLTTLNSYRIIYLLRPIIWIYKHRNIFSNGRGCNMAVWRDDIIAINGYNEEFTEWGFEDSDIILRLINSGVNKQNLKLGAVQYHLYHSFNSRHHANRNLELLRTEIKRHATYCQNGIDKYL